MGRSFAITGIGYQGRTQAEVIADLRARGTALVADVRLTPRSRKAGLSRTALTRDLLGAGIDYVHLPALGNPPDNRGAFADTRGAAGRGARDRYRVLLAGERAGEALRLVLDRARVGPVTLLCFEADEDTCHRQLVLAALRTPSGPGRVP